MFSEADLDKIYALAVRAAQGNCPPWVLQNDTIWSQSSTMMNDTYTDDPVVCGGSNQRAALEYCEAVHPDIVMGLISQLKFLSTRLEDLDGQSEELRLANKSVETLRKMMLREAGKVANLQQKQTAQDDVHPHLMSMHNNEQRRAYDKLFEKNSTLSIKLKKSFEMLEELLDAEWMVTPDWSGTTERSALLQKGWSMVEDHKAEKGS